MTAEQIRRLLERNKPVDKPTTDAWTLAMTRRADFKEKRHERPRQ